MKTQAAILVRQRRPLEVVDLEIPALKPHQILVRIVSAGVCGSQIGEIDGLKGKDPYLPHCLGHEAGAVVEEAGSGVRKAKRGDHVVLHWKVGEGKDAEPASYRWGKKTVNAGRVTAFQRHAVVSENRVTVIPQNIPFRTAALYGCAVTTGFGVVEKDAKVRRGESVLVIGAGGVGQIQIVAARHAGATPIVACDVHASKLKLALKNGATHAVKSGPGLDRALRKILNGRALDAVFENTGLKRVIEFAYEACGPRGRTILVGVPDSREKAEIDTLPLHFGKVLTGSFGGDARPAEDIPRILDLERRHGWNFGSLASPGYTLERINDAIADLRTGRAVRPLIDMGE